ncbi:hypothetical protein CEXT_451541 [Caerostris extrusa]|uniref:Secreted protein n=1 Tax=Caerostris extrusa TaxID=172846 RepID=A0AAV4W651_CAEEX|nr:hypothetical protein CEXT_451541 [Caerostris extrusa]
MFFSLFHWLRPSQICAAISLLFDIQAKHISRVDHCRARNDCSSKEEERRYCLLMAVFGSGVIKLLTEGFIWATQTFTDPVIADQGQRRGIAVPTVVILTQEDEM